MVWPLCTGLISVSLSLVESRYRQMVPFSFRSITKQLQHSAISSTPRGMLICCSCRCPSSFSMVLVMDMLGVPSLTCNENVPLKHPIPKNITVCIVQFFCYLPPCIFLFQALHKNKSVSWLFLPSCGRLIFQFLSVLNFSCLDCSLMCPLLWSTSSVL